MSLPPLVANHESSARGMNHESSAGSMKPKRSQDRYEEMGFYGLTLIDRYCWVSAVTQLVGAVTLAVTQQV